MDPKQHEKIAVNVSTVTIVINLALAGFKFLAGFLAHSGAMVSDAVHSASDVLATFIVILGVKLAGRDADRDHPYGHERLECVAALILGAILAATGLGIGMSGIRKITGGEELLIPGVMLRHEQDKFLDDGTIEDVQQALGVSVRTVDNDGTQFLLALLGIEDDAEYAW